MGTLGTMRDQFSLRAAMKWEIENGTDPVMKEALQAIIDFHGENGVSPKKPDPPGMGKKRRLHREFADRYYGGEPTPEDILEKLEQGILR